jgi:tRNA dimethylallyltransferase
MAETNTTAPPYIMIAGPTASGKSQLAYDLAVHCNGAVINADSMQLYADLSVLTARPQPHEIQYVPHHLFGVLDAAHRASVADWLARAAKVIETVRAAGQCPIIVGGTGMYLQAGLRGIAPVPDVPAAVHQRCVDMHRALGPAKFRSELARLDADIAERLVEGDSQRLIRAMGVALATQHPLSWWQQQPHKGAFSGTAITIAVVPPRPVLYDRINARFDQMLAAGALDEVKRLMTRRLDPGLPLMKALGVAPLAAVLQGEMDLADAASLAKRDSRRYAKRQMTWVRNNYNAQFALEKKFSESLAQKIFSFIR